MTQVKDVTDEMVFAAWRSHGVLAWQELVAQGFPKKVVERKFEQIVNRGLAECGMWERVARPLDPELAEEWVRANVRLKAEGKLWP